MSRQGSADGQSAPCDAATGLAPRLSSSLRLQAMRANPDETCADVELHAGSTVVRAHRSVLSTYEYFRNMLGTGSAFSEARTGRVDFPDISGTALHVIVDYVYEVEMKFDIDLETLREIYDFAALHCMDDLKISARDILLRHATPKSILETLRQAVQLDDDVATKAASRFVFDTAGAYDFSVEIGDCSEHELEALRLEVSEQSHAVWASLVMAWMAVDPIGRHEKANELIECVDFSRLTAAEVVKLSKLDFRPQDPVHRIERQLQETMSRRLEQVLEQRDEITTNFPVGPVQCSTDICGTVVCTFARNRHNNAMVSCSRCGRERCDGVFSAMGTCTKCGRQANDMRRLHAHTMRSVVGTLGDTER